MGNMIPHGDRLHECTPGCPEAPREELRQRPGDQALPTGDETLADDQSLLIQDIEERRQLGIQRYGQGHRPFNGRNTLRDVYEEQLDLLVYLRSIVRMAETTKEELVKVVSKELASNGFQQIVADAMAEQVIERMQGWIAANMIEPPLSEKNQQRAALGLPPIHDS